MNEDKIEQSALELLSNIGYEVIYGPDIGPEGTGERESYKEMILEERLRNALVSCNAHIPETAIEEAIGKVKRSVGTSLLLDNKDFHSYLANGVEVEYRDT